MKTKKKTNYCQSFTIQNPSSSRNLNCASFAIRSSRCLVLLCIIAKSVGKRSVMLVRRVRGAYPKWRRKSTGFAMSVTACWVITISSACTNEKSKIKKVNSKKSLNASSPPRRRSQSVLISSQVWRSNTSKSCKKWNQNKAFVISKWINASSRLRRWLRQIRKWKRSSKHSKLRSTPRIRNWPSWSFRNKRLMRNQVNIGRTSCRRLKN